MFRARSAFDRFIFLLGAQKGTSQLAVRQPCTLPIDRAYACWPQGLGGITSRIDILSTRALLVQYRVISGLSDRLRAAVIDCLRQTPEAGRRDGATGDSTGGRGRWRKWVFDFPPPILDQELRQLGVLPTRARILIFTCLYGSPSASLLSSGEYRPVVALPLSWACIKLHDMKICC